MRCYVCEAPVSREMHERVVAEVNEFDLETDERYTEALGLVHCTGPEDMFDAVGGVVVCWNCHERGKQA
jgi:hypothetical protein